MTQQNFRLAPPTRFPGGIATQPQTHTLGNFKDHDPFKLITLEDDFLAQNLYTTSDTYGWFVDTLSGTQGTPVVGLIAGLGGILSVATSAGAPDDTILRSQVASWQPNETTNLWLYGKFRMADVVAPVLRFGFFGTTYDISFLNVAGSGQMYLHLHTPSKASTNFSLGPNAIAVANTYFTIGLYYDFTHSQLVCYFNEVECLRLNLLTDIGGNLTDELEFAAFGIQNAGTAQANTLLVDYVLFSQSR